VHLHQLGHDAFEVGEDLDFREHLGVLIYRHESGASCRI
jgi:hypothetical protein